MVHAFPETLPRFGVGGPRRSAHDGNPSGYRSTAAVYYRGSLSVPDSPLARAAKVVDGGDMDCGSGLLLLITRAMRRLQPGQLLGIRSAQRSVLTE